MTTIRMQNRIDAGLKVLAEEILHEQGITPSVAITMFYTEIARNRGLPFQPSKVPNAKLRKVLNDVKNDHDVLVHESLDALFDYLDNEQQ